MSTQRFIYRTNDVEQRYERGRECATHGEEQRELSGCVESRGVERPVGVEVGGQAHRRSWQRRERGGR